MEPATAIGTGLAILGSKEVLTKLLGPTADYVGGEVKGFVEKCNVNLEVIFQKAVRKLGDRIGDKGAVNPRVLKHIVDEGRFCEDELVAEYYGGVLASARSPNGRDDRGVVQLALIEALSVYQLRFHYLVYSLVAKHFSGSELNPGKQDDCLNMRLFVPTRVFKRAMDITAEEDTAAIMIHCLFGLKRHELIKDFFSGGPEYMKSRFPGMQVDEAGLLVSPWLPGAELYLWAAGITGASGAELLKVVLPPINPGVEILDGTVPFSRLVTPRTLTGRGDR